MQAQLTGTSNFFTDRVQPGVQERMERHARIFADHAQRNTGYYRAMESMYLAGIRGPDVEQNRRDVAKARAEFRALTTGGGATVSASGGGVAAFVWPSFLLDQFAVFRSPCRVLADQLNTSVALPSYGMQVMVPTITATASVTTTTEGDATSESDPTMTFAGNAAVKQLSGQLTLSQAILDRVGPGMSADVWVFQQLKSLGRRGRPSGHRQHPCGCCDGHGQQRMGCHHRIGSRWHGQGCGRRQGQADRYLGCKDQRHPHLLSVRCAGHRDRLCRRRGQGVPALQLPARPRGRDPRRGRLRSAPMAAGRLRGRQHPDLGQRQPGHRDQAEPHAAHGGHAPPCTASRSTVPPAWTPC